MKKLILLSSLIVSTSLLANEYIPNKKCKSCHNNIYNEFMQSSHANSTLSKNKIHSAMWGNHPAKSKGYDKSCAKCHNPTNNEEEAISCAYCHRIKDVNHGKNSNSTIMSNTLKSYYGVREDKSGSPFHRIITTNDEYKKANICLSCHSHKNNPNGLSVCKTEHNNSTKENCITCHMPQVNGTRADDIKTQTHSYHGFAGVSKSHKMLSKYIDLSVLRENSKLEVTVGNNSPHALFLQPLRVGIVKLTIKRDGKKIVKIQEFKKVYKDGKKVVGTPYAKNIDDTTIKANSTKKFVFDDIKDSDSIKVTLGYHLVDPTQVKALGLNKEYKVRKLYKIKEISVK
jgi:hypothetical protein